MTIVTRGHGQNLVRTGMATVTHIAPDRTDDRCIGQRNLYGDRTIIYIKLNDGQLYGWYAEKRDVEIYSKKVVR
jgi:hypothetical protein